MVKFGHRTFLHLNVLIELRSRNLSQKGRRISSTWGVSSEPGSKILDGYLINRQGCSTRNNSLELVNVAAGRDIDRAIKPRGKSVACTRACSRRESHATTWKHCYRVSVHRAPALTADRAETFTASVSVNRRGTCRFYLLAPRSRRNPPTGDGPP